MSLCPHFGICGGCAYQDKADAEYRALKRQSVAEALARHGVAADIEEMVEVAPATRRRAALKVKAKDGKVLLGFHAARSHDIVDIETCRVLSPTLTALLPGLRACFADLLAPAGDGDIRLTDSETGIDLSLRWRRPNDSDTLGKLARWAATLKLARISVNGQAVVSLATPQVRLGKAAVALPPETFLQPTLDGEAALQAFVTDSLKRSKKVADLFCGCGTFTFPLAETARVHAVELEGVMLDALAAAVKTTPGLKPITTEKRNLFKRPLSDFELKAYDGVAIDPPRAGALDQAKMLAKSNVARIAYVSCDADSFARDARVLGEGGYRLTRLVPVDQFLWSTHIELAAAFLRR